MQKLKAKLKNVPRNASQVSCSTNLSLNKDESLSVVSKVLAFNNPEVNQPQHHTGGLKDIVYVFVLNINRMPLMPCTPTKARHLIKNKRAKVKKLFPFTIQLLFDCEKQVQDLTLGVDTGFKHIGFSVVSAKKELISGELNLDGKTSERLTEKKMYRKLKRNKLWYRKPRFSNRKINEGWLPPSTERRYQTHVRLINLIKEILPISRLNIELANFDIQKIENSNISGTTYQQGSKYGYQNTRSYLMAREKGLCQLCHKPFIKGNSSHIHHCKQKSESGSNRPKNLALLHEKCHTKLHAKRLKLTPAKEYKQSTFMNIVKNKFMIDFPNLNETFGYITFLKRNEINLIKTHNNDAFVIAEGNNQERCKVSKINQKHRNNRAIQLNRKGFKSAIRKQRYNIQPKDIVWIGKKKFIAAGVQNKGEYLKIENKKVIAVKNITKIYNFNGFSWIC